MKSCLHKSEALTSGCAPDLERSGLTDLRGQKPSEKQKSRNDSAALTRARRLACALGAFRESDGIYFSE